MNFKNLFSGCQGKKTSNDLNWLNEPEDWSFDNDGKLTIIPNAVTDFFRPYGQSPNDNACLLYTKVTGDFTVVTKTKAVFAGFGDATAITVRSKEDLWAKVCMEQSPIGDISVVSVVTNGYSDDSNGELLQQPECYLRITRNGDVFGMHYSLDGKVWRFVRYVVFPAPKEVMVGVHAQAPFAGGCEGEFEFFKIANEAVKDFRSGE